MKNHDDFAGVMYYYVRNGKSKKSVGTPYAVVAVRENDDGTVNRGVSMCSPLDTFKKVIGRGIAMQRLIKAETDCRCSGKFKKYNGDDSKRNVWNDEFFTKYAYKSGFHEQINDREYRMFHKPGE